MPHGLVAKPRRQIAIATILAICSVTLHPVKARSQPALLAPALCSTGVGCILVGVATIGGIAYWVWQNQKTGERFYQHTEEPEEHEQWGVFYAKDAWRCRQLAAGRYHKYDSVRKRCYIKG